MSEPVIVELGRYNRKVVKALRTGDPDAVAGVLEELRAAGSLGEETVPVVFVVERRRKPKLPKLG